MIKKIFFTSVYATISLGAFAETPRDMMAKLTEEQKACVATHGCVVPEQPETTVAMNAFMECMKNAKTVCGIDAPVKTPAPEVVAPKTPADTPVPEIVAPETPADTPVPEIVAPETPADTPVPEIVAEQNSGTAESSPQE